MRGLNRDLLTAFSKVLGHAKPKSVHRLRITIRRIESLVSYANPDLGKKEERTLKKMADLRKRAGKVRDFDVQTDILETLGNGSAIKEREALTELLQKKREQRAKRLESALKKLHGAKFLSRLDHIAELAGELQDGKNRVAPLEKAKAQLTEMADDFGSSETIKPSRLHETRVALKHIRYTAELAEDSAEQKELMRELKSVQDAIGDWHDWLELTEKAEKRFSDRANSPLLREARTVLSARHSDAISSVKKLFTKAQAPAKKPSRSDRSLPTAARSA
ncbi:MAG: CHAD domain-containing protein [Acidobacteriia bacterium]|nr:CHAD domain-containing protein [Terriglobia bacterium]